MDSMSLPLPVGTIHQEARNFEETAQFENHRNWKGLVLPTIAIALWLVVGASLTWLLKDFNRSLAPERSVFSPSLIVSLFLTFAVVMGVFSWNSWRNAPAR